MGGDSGQKLWTFFSLYIDSYILGLMSPEGAIHSFYTVRIKQNTTLNEWFSAFFVQAKDQTPEQKADSNIERSGGRGVKNLTQITAIASSACSAAVCPEKLPARFVAPFSSSLLQFKNLSQSRDSLPLFILRKLAYRKVN